MAAIKNMINGWIEYIPHGKESKKFRKYHMEGKKTNKITKIKNFKHGQNLGGNTKVNRVSFVGWLVVGGSMCFFFCTFRFPS